MAKKDYEVAHAKLYLRVDGKLQHVPRGTSVTMDTNAADQLGDKVKPVSKGKSVEVDAPKGKSTDTI